MKLILLGPPGCGKGTQAELLAQHFNIPAISTGAMIRDAIRTKSALGVKMEGYIEKGRLVPDDIVLSLIKERLSENDCQSGYILDGFPRTIAQAEALLTNGEQVDKALNLAVSDEKIASRLAGRRECKNCRATYHLEYNPPKTRGKCDRCGGELVRRGDDAPATVLERLAVYHRQTEPLIDFFEKRNLLVTVQGREQVADTTREVLRALETERT